jgi:hypothetical protein
MSGSKIKETLENKLNQLICDNQLDLTIAQQVIASNWITAGNTRIKNLR